MGALAAVAVRDAKAPLFIAHKSINRNPSRRIKIEQQVGDVIRFCNHSSARLSVYVLRSAQLTVKAGMLRIAPVQDATVQIVWLF